MPKESGPSEIASVSVGVTVDTAGLEAGMAKAKQETEASAAAMGNAVEASGDKSQRSFKETAREAKGLLQPLRALSGIAAALVSLGYAVAEAWKYVSNVFGEGKGKAEAFLGALSEGVGRDAEARLGSIRDRIQEVQAELARNLEKNPLDIRGRSTATIQGELDRLRLSERSVSQQIRAQERAAAAAKRKAEATAEEVLAADALMTIQNELADAEEEQASEQEQINNKYEDRLNLLERLRASGKVNADELARLAEQAARVAAAEHARLRMGDEMVERYKDQLKALAAIDRSRRAATDAVSLDNMATDIRQLHQLVRINLRQTENVPGSGEY